MIQKIHYIGDEKANRATWGHEITWGLIGNLERQHEEGVSSKPRGQSHQTAMRPWAGLSWQELGLWRKGLLDHEGHVPLPERRYCTRQNKRRINTLTSPVLAYSSASYWMNPPRRQLAKDPGRCNSLRCRAEEGRNGKWIWELAGKLYHTAHGTLEIALISEHPYYSFSSSNPGGIF